MDTKEQQEAVATVPPKADPPPTNIKLTREEALDLENINLRTAMAQQELARLEEDKKRWMNGINAKHGINVDGWIVNTMAGVAVDPRPKVSIVKADDKAAG